ncbi:MAG: hypothetical protein ACKV2O_09015 [Acidimicrobiales bacterium]
MQAGEAFRIETGLQSSLAVAVQLNVTVVDPAAAGYLTVFPCGDRPGTSTLNFDALQTVANAATAPLGAGGELCFYTTAETDLVVDFNGYMPATGAFRSLRPERLFDTRSDGQLGPAAKVPGGQSIRVQVTGVSDVPVGAAAVSMNLTVTEADTEGFVTAYPCGGLPLASNLNHPPVSAVPNAVVVGLDAGGGFCLFSTSTAHLLGDLNGWFAGSGGLRSVVERKLDTREKCGSGAAVARETGNLGGNEFSLGWGACGDVLAFVVDGASRAGVDIKGFTLQLLELTADGAPRPSCWRHVVTVLPRGAGGFDGQLTRRSTCDPVSSVDVGAVYVSLDATSGKLTILLPLPDVRTGSEIVWRATVHDFNGRPVEAPSGFGGQEAWFRGAVPPFPPSNEKYFVPVETMFGTAAIVNLTATGSSRGGYAVAEPCDNPALTSTVNYRAGQTRANLAIVPLSLNSEGKRGFCVRGTDTHLVVDLLGVLGLPGT